MRRALPPLPWLLPAVLITALFLLWTDNSYSDLSDGVYLYISRATLDGSGLYSEVVSSVPPPIIWFGALLLKISDSVYTVRIALAVILLLTSWLVLYTTERLSGSRSAGIVAGLIYLVTLYTLKEKLALVGESFQAPLLLLAAVLASRQRTATFAGIAAAVGITIKLTFIAPAVALILAAKSKQRYLTGLLAASGVLWLLFSLIYGGDMYRDIVSAQSESGFHVVSHTVKLLAKAFAIELPLLIGAAAIYLVRDQVKDQALLKSLLLALLGGLAMLASTTKEGTDSYIIGASEPLLVVLAVTGLWLVASKGSERYRSKAKLVAGAAGAVMLLQIALFLNAPNNLGPIPNPLDGRNASPSQVDSVVEVVKACPKDAPYFGPPYYAFLANRKMAGNQADLFLFNVAGGTVLKDKNKQIEAELPLVCPAPQAYQFKHY